MLQYVLYNVQADVGTSMMIYSTMICNRSKLNKPINLMQKNGLWYFFFSIILILFAV